MRAAAGTRRDPGASELLTAAPPRPSPAAARVSPCVSQPTSPFLSRGGEAAGFLLSRSVGQSVSQSVSNRGDARLRCPWLGLWLSPDREPRQTAASQPCSRGRQTWRSPLPCHNPLLALPFRVCSVEPTTHSQTPAVKPRIACKARFPLLLGKDLFLQAQPPHLPQ